MTPIALMTAGSLVAGLGLVLVLGTVTGLGVLLIPPGVALAWVGLLRRRARTRVVDASGAGLGDGSKLKSPRTHP